MPRALFLTSFRQHSRISNILLCSKPYPNFLLCIQSLFQNFLPYFRAYSESSRALNLSAPEAASQSRILPNCTPPPSTRTKQRRSKFLRRSDRDAMTTSRSCTRAASRRRTPRSTTSSSPTTSSPTPKR